MAKSTTKANALRKSVGKRISDEQALERSAKQAKAIVEKHNRDLAKRKKALLKGLDMEQVIAAINAEKKMYDAAFKNFKGSEDDLNRMKAIAKQISRNRLIKKQPAIRKIMSLNMEGKKELTKLIHPSDTDVFDDYLLDNPITVTDYVAEFEIFESPFAFPRKSSSSPFDMDNSFTFPPWGIMGHNFKFKHFHSGSLFAENSYKYGNVRTEMGMNYRTRKAGRVEIYFEISNLRSDVDFSITDNFWFSEAQFTFDHRLNVKASGGSSPLYQQTIFPVRTDRYSDGDDKSGPPILLEVPTDFPLVLKVETDFFLAGQTIELRFSALTQINSNLTNMNTVIDANIIWLLERIWIRVV